MKKPFKISEHYINNLVKRVINEEDQDEWVKVSPEQYLEIMKYASYNAKGVSMLPQYRGKKIWITGDLIVKDLPIKSLEGIGYVEGNLDISRTGINDISFINVKGRVSDYESGVDRIRKQKIKQEKLAGAQSRREDNEWSYESGDDTGTRARAVMEYIENSNSRVSLRTEEDNVRLKELERQMESLLEKEKQYDEEGKDLTDVYADIEAVEEEITEINDKMDVYHLIPEEGYGFYRMDKFEVVGNDDLEGAEYAVGTESETERSCREYLDDQFDSPEQYFSESFLENHIDEDEVLDYFRDHYEYDVESNPEVYFNDDDFELSSKQEEEKYRLEQEIAEYEERQENLDSEIEDPEEYSRMYDQIQEHIDSLQEQIDDMEPDGEPSQDMIDNKVEELLYDVKRNLIDYMKDWGMKIGEYINKEDAIQDIIDSDGYGHILNGYDGEYDTVEMDGETYVVMRVG
jgi:predicted  nucleic acid-binding Zn-ribbon protein